jgi:ABC-type transporter Mla subunit MlaD
VNYFRNLLDRLPASRGQVARLGEKIMATQAEHAQQLRDLHAQNEKAAAEQAAALQRLQDALDAAGGTTAEVDEAMAALRASIQREDDLNPDTPAPQP